MPTSTVAYEMLDVSTAHLTRQTRHRLETFELEGVLYYPKGPWGWFVNIPSPEDLVLGEELPSDLKACIHTAQSLGAEWIMFDCDGTVLPSLETFEDEETPWSSNQAVLRQLALAYANHLSLRYGRDIKATVTSSGKICAKEDDPEGMYALVSAQFVHAVVMRKLPVLDSPLNRAADL